MKDEFPSTALGDAAIASDLLRWSGLYADSVATSCRLLYRDVNGPPSEQNRTPPGVSASLRRFLGSSVDRGTEKSLTE
jgi:hypothetical protein